MCSPSAFTWSTSLFKLAASGAAGSNGTWRCIAALGSSQIGRPDGDADRRGDALRDVADDDERRGGTERGRYPGPLNAVSDGVRLLLPSSRSGESLRSNSRATS